MASRIVLKRLFASPLLRCPTRVVKAAAKRGRKPAVENPIEDSIPSGNQTQTSVEGQSSIQPAVTKVVKAKKLAGVEAKELEHQVSELKAYEQGRSDVDERRRRRRRGSELGGDTSEAPQGITSRKTSAVALPAVAEDPMLTEAARADALGCA